MNENIQFVLADHQHGSILNLHHKEAFVATNSMHARTSANVFDPISCRISQDMKLFLFSFFTWKMSKSFHDLLKCTRLKNKAELKGSNGLDLTGL